MSLILKLKRGYVEVQRVFQLLKFRGLREGTQRSSNEQPRYGPRAAYARSERD